MYKPDNPWGSANKTGHIRWDLSYYRGPDCGPKDTFGRQHDEEDYWGRSGLMEKCCDDKIACYEDDAEVILRPY